MTHACMGSSADDEWKHCEGCPDLEGCEAHGCLKDYKAELEDCDDKPQNAAETHKQTDKEAKT